MIALNTYCASIFLAQKSHLSPSHDHPGHSQFIFQFWTGLRYDPSKYKYVVVPMGSGVLSSSGRLAHLLAHSGAVVLMQEAGFSYHFRYTLLAEHDAAVQHSNYTCMCNMIALVCDRGCTMFLWPTTWPT